MEKNFAYNPKTEHIMSDLTRMEELTLKKLLGEITPEEDKDLEAMAQASEENRRFIDRLSPKAFREQDYPNEIDLDRFDRLTRRKIGNIPGVLDWIPATGEKRSLRPYIIGTAACLLLLFGSWWFLHQSHTAETANNPMVATLSWETNSDYDQGTNDAGSIALGDMKEGQAYIAGAIQIARIRNQLFIIDTVTARTANLTYHLKDEGKGDVRVFFHDTSSMQLSTGSSLSFFTHPSGTVLKEKRLACEGQVLFNIGHNFNIPTVVQTLKQEIAVLGTFFMVRDYKSEDTGAVFCYSGEISVRDAERRTRIVPATYRVTAKPSHGLILSSGDFPKANWSSPELLFDFSDMDLDDAMKEIAAWYGISNVWFQPGIDRKRPGRVFTGKVSRYLTLRQLLSILDRNDLHFSIRGRELYVTGSTDRPDHDH